jgi:hypothetical protein
MSQDRAATDAAPRELCLRCLRPRRACWCPHLRPVESATRSRPVGGQVSAPERVHQRPDLELHPPGGPL